MSNHLTAPIATGPAVLPTVTATQGNVINPFITPTAASTHFQNPFAQSYSNPPIPTAHYQNPPSHDVSGSIINPWNGMIGSMKRGIDLQTIHIAKFDGNPLDYHRFISEFDSAFEAENIDPSERHDIRTKLYKLISYCTGKALTALDGCRAGRQDEPAYRRAREILFNNFGRDSYVVNAFIDQLTNSKPIDTTNIQALIDASDQLQSAQHILKQCKSISQVNAGKNLHGVLGRYPVPFLLRFLGQHADKMAKGIDPTFEDFVSFVNKEAAIVRTPLGRFIFDLRKAKAAKYTQKTQVKVHATSIKVPASTDKEKESQSTKKPPSSCVLCNDLHALFKCSKFNEKSSKECRKNIP